MNETSGRLERHCGAVETADYCLDPHHPRGRHKARAFLAVLGLKQSDADVLRMALLDAARDADAVVGESDQYGARYMIDFTTTHQGRHARVRSGWMVLHGESAPRLTSCFVLLKRGRHG